jgi:hypothetical protein
VFALVVALGLVAGVRPAPAEAQDLLILLAGQTRRGELTGCDATACRLDTSTVPRSEIVFIGLDDPPLPIPAVRNFLQDELHLPDGSIRPGPLVSIDARQVVTPARTYARREVRWIYLARAPASGGVARPAASSGGSQDDGTCGFWVGTLHQRVQVRHTTTLNQLRKNIRTVYAARFRETTRWGPGSTTVGTRGIQATSVLLRLDDGFVRENVRGTLSGPGGNRVLGSGAGGFGDQVGGGRLVTEVPSGPTYYDVRLRAVDFKYPVTVRPFSGQTHQSDEGVLGIGVGTGADPEQPRTMAAGSQLMKGEYVVTAPEGAHIVGRTVAWNLTRLTARCDAPPEVPPLPAESEPSDGDASDADKP